MNQTQNTFSFPSNNIKQKDKLPALFSKTTKNFLPYTASQDKPKVKPPTPLLIKEPIKPIARLNTPSQGKRQKNCNLCGQEIMADLVYQNESCGHKYCYYCLLDIKDSHSGLTFCFLKSCPHKMDIKHANEFCKKRGEEEKKSESEGLNEGKGIKREEIKELIQKKVEGDNNVKEEKPAIENKTKKKFFVNKEENQAKSPVKFIVRDLNKNKQPQSLHLDNKNKDTEKVVVLEKDKGPSEKAGLEDIVNVSCRSCEYDTTVTVSKGATLMCWRCWKCQGAQCYKHSDVVSKCLCCCPKCMFSVTDKPLLNIKECGKCSICYCRVCLKERKPNEPCLTCNIKVKEEEKTNAVPQSGLLSQPKSLEDKMERNNNKDNFPSEKFDFQKKNKLQMNLTCPKLACKVQTTLKLSSDNGKLLSWKCLGCLEVFCYEHYNNASKCLCCCPKCMFSVTDKPLLNIKECGKCSICYCRVCLKENKPNEPCIDCNMKKEQEKINIVAPESYLSFQTRSIKDNLDKDIKEKLPNHLGSYIQVNDKPGRTFFIFGFLLVQDILSQPVSDELRSLQQSILSSYKYCQENGNVQELDSVRFHGVLEGLIVLGQLYIGDRILDPKNKMAVAEFIMHECQENREIEIALEQIGRCALIECMITQEFNRKVPSLLKKLSGDEWKSSGGYEEDLVSMFCEYFDYNIEMMCRSGKAKEINVKYFGRDSSRYKAYMLDLEGESKFRAILYKSK